MTSQSAFRGDDRVAAATGPADFGEFIGVGDILATCREVGDAGTLALGDLGEMGGFGEWGGGGGACLALGLLVSATPVGWSS